MDTSTVPSDDVKNLSGFPMLFERLLSVSPTAPFKFPFFCLLFVRLMPNLCRGAISGRCYQNRPLHGSRDTDTGVFSFILSFGCWIYDGAKWMTEFKATLFVWIDFPFFSILNEICILGIMLLIIGMISFVRQLLLNFP